MSLLNARFQQNRRKSKANAEYWAGFEGNELEGRSRSGNASHGSRSNGVVGLSGESSINQNKSVDVEVAREAAEEAGPQKSSTTSPWLGTNPDLLGQDIANVLSGVTVVKQASPYATSPKLVQSWDKGFTATNSSAMALHGHGHKPSRPPLPLPPPMTFTTRSNDVELVGMPSGSVAASNSASSSPPANVSASDATPHPHTNTASSESSTKPTKSRGLFRQSSASTGLRGNRKSKDGLSRDSGDLAEVIDQSPQARERAALLGLLEAANVPAERADSLAGAGLSSVESLLELNALPASQVGSRRRVSSFLLFFSTLVRSFHTSP